MQIREIKITNYRGIESLTWRPGSPISCIVGAGDVGKSTVLDAIEAVLSTKRQLFFDTDFLGCDTDRAFEIVATVGQLPREALDDYRMGHYLRGWSATHELHDEPQEGDERVVTVRLTVDASLEPIWELITDRQPPKTLHSKDRALFGVVRLTGDTDAHLACGQYSLLARLSTDKGSASGVLTEAYRKARELIKENPLPALNEIAGMVRDAAKRFGAYSSDSFVAGLDTQRSATALASLALHSDGVPLRMSGTGTRRLIALAVQNLAVPEGAIVLIDELEHGLEPHRIRHSLKVLRDGVARSSDQTAGQVILTTHSSVTVTELTTAQIAVMCRAFGQLALRTPDASLQALIRKRAEAVLGRKIVVCEGKTEIGLLRGMRDWWTERHNDEPIEFHGTVLTDGEGSSARSTAVNLAKLGYDVAVFRDSDIALTPKDFEALSAARVEIIAWDEETSTEQRLFTDVSDAGVQSMLDVAYRRIKTSAVKSAIASSLGIEPPISDSYSDWIREWRRDPEEIRRVIAECAHKDGWYKQIQPGEELGAVLIDELRAGEGKPYSAALQKLEKWIYGYAG